jgi:hypothetical protein
MNEFRDIVKSTSGVRLKCDPKNCLRCANAWEFEWDDLRELKLCVSVRECVWMFVNACELKCVKKRFIKNILWYLGGKMYFDEFVSWDEYEKILSKKLSFWIYALRLVRKRFIKFI